MLVANSLDTSLSAALESADFYEFKTGWCVPQSFDSLLETSRSPSTGLFYVVLLPAGWKLAVYRDEPSGISSTHTEFWSANVCSIVSRLWLRALKSTRLGRRGSSLAMHPRAFPRGRVAYSHGVPHVFHSPSIIDSPQVDRLVIEQVFGIQGEAIWIDDTQEQCLLVDKEVVREMLLLEEDWGAMT